MSSALDPDLPLTWSRAALAVCLLLVVFLIVQAHVATRRPKNFPPGPRGVPFLGNLASIPLVKSYVTFAEWTKQYGPIIGLKAGPLNLIVLQDPEDIHELYDRRGHLYAGRPYNYIALNHVFDPEMGQILLFQRNDRLLKRWKRPARWFLSQQGIDSLGPIIDSMSSRCVKSLVDRPGDFLEHLRVWALSTPLVALSGQADVSPELLRTYFYRQKLLTGLLEPGKTPPVDFIVPLRWVPARWAKWKRDAKFVREHQEGFYGEMVARAKAARERRREGGPAGEYVCVMERLMDEEMPETEVKWLAGGLLDAAFDTSSAAVLNFVVAMAGHPEVLAKARDEIEVVCQGKMPNGEDVARLPYLKACMLEMLRWRPSTPLGLPHVTESDDTYKGYVIPRGTNVVVNAYGLLHDPAIHRDPDTFDPSRYLDAAVQNDELLRSTWVFGAGRRKCLGEQYTMQALLTIMAKVVWALDMAVPAGTDLSVEEGFDGGLMMKPREGLVVEVKVREGRAKGVEDDWERGEAELRRMLGTKIE
ncbi:cytochrome P450 [Ilyonectria destructans]|nr:cytochrome P450 [Ilyonectria destructans]